MTYFLYDTAINGDYSLVILQQQYANAVSLFAGTKDESLSDIAPYLFEIDKDFIRKVADKPYVELVGSIFIETSNSLPDLAAHLRTFIYQTINGRECYFRFWDSRVLNKFLPTCSRDQITAFFGPMEVLTMHEANPSMVVQYRQERGKLLALNMPALNYYGGAVNVNESDKLGPEPIGDIQVVQKKQRKFL